MTIKQIERVEKQLFSSNYHSWEKREYPMWPTIREAYTLEELLEPWRVR